MKSRLTAGLVGLTVLVLAAVPAGAASGRGRIVSITPAKGNVDIVFSGIGLAPGSTINPGSVKVTVGGVAVTSTASTITTGSRPVRRTAILVIDTSGSMRGSPLAGARNAARTFISRAPSDVRIGLVTFSSTANLVTPPTTDRRTLASAVTGVHAQGRTAMYDAVKVALQAAGRSGPRSIVLLTDGNDDASSATLPQLSAQARRSGVIIDSVAFRTRGETNAPLQALATSTRGQVLAASRSGGLVDAFRNEARNIASEILITAVVPATLAGQSGTVRVTADAGGTTLSDQAFVRLPKPAVPATPNAFGPQAVRPARGLSGVWAAIAVALLFVALFFMVIAVWGRDTGGSGERVRHRLSIYTLTGRVDTDHEAEPTALGTSAIARSAVELAGRVVRSGDFETGLARRLEAASLPLRPAEWLLLHVGIALIFGLGLLLATGRLVAGLLGVVIGVVLPLLFLNIREDRRRSAFLAELPDTLQLIAGSLSAGYSLPQAIDTVIREGQSTAAIEFNRALVETRLGLPLEDALDGIAQRTRSTDFGWVVMAIRIHREVGGNLAEVLHNVAETLRERERLRRQVSVLSAEGRLSAYILGGLPPLFATYLILVRPQYLRVLYTSTVGIVMLVIAALLTTVGVTWLRRVVRVEV
jgi:tight adherence protein B